MFSGSVIVIGTGLLLYNIYYYYYIFKPRDSRETYNSKDVQMDTHTHTHTEVVPT